MPSFFLLDAMPMVKDAPTMKMHEVLDLDDIAHKLKLLYKREITHGGGPKPYEPLSMFKLMLLSQSHGLSDGQLGQSLKVRFHFMVCTGFGPSDWFPDATTILADKGYASAVNRAALTKRGRDLIQFKGHKNMILANWQTQMNKDIGVRTGDWIDEAVIPPSGLGAALWRSQNKSLDVRDCVGYERLEGQPQAMENAVCFEHCHPISVRCGKR